MATERFSGFLDGGLLSVGSMVVGLNAATTPTNTIWNFPGSGILDANGSSLLTWTPPSTGTAVNSLDLTSSISGQPLSINAKGGDLDVALSISSKGAGAIFLVPGTSGYLQISGTGAAIFPSGTTAQRPTVSVAGMFRYNQSTNLVEYYNTSLGQWTSLLGAGSVVVSVLGTANEIDSTGGTSPVISISNTYPGQASINTVGTITAGTWNADVISPSYGGTGADNGMSILSLGGSLSTLGAFDSTFTMTGPTNVTFPTTGVLSTTTGTVTSVNGTTGQISSSGGSDPIISIDTSYMGQASITTLGTVTSGIWNATVLDGRYGGTGVANTGKTLTLGGSLITAGGFTSTFTMTGNTNVTFPTTGVLSTVDGTVATVSGTPGQITVGGTVNNPIISIDPTYIGQSSINTVGTITNGDWNGSPVPGQYGGTGVSNPGKTITLGGNLATSGAFNSVFTMTGPTNVTFPTSGTLSTTVGTVTSVNGTPNRVTSTGGAAPVIDIAATYVGQSSITTLGTVTSGAWNASIVSPVFGGTGVNNSTNTLTLAGSLATIGSFPVGFTFTGSTNVTFPVSGTLSTTVGTVTSVSGTSGRITSTGGAAPIIDIDAAYVGQASITTLGTVTTGTWNADVLSPVYGGTGVNNGASTLTLASALATVGAFPATFNFTGATNVIFPLTGTLSTTVGTVTDVLGTLDRITSTGGATPTIDIDAGYLGQASITTLGTITTGTWNADIVAPSFGGTGINNGNNTLTLAGSLATIGAFAANFNFTAATNVTFPISGTLSTTVGTVTSVSGTANRITSTGGATPVIDISTNYIGQSSITTLGLIAAGTWNGDIIDPAFGGTGINNGSSTLTLADSLQTIGAFPAAFNFTAGTNVTFPTTGTLATTANTVASVSGVAGEIVITGTSTSPIVGLVSTAVTPGSYTYSSLTVDSKGRLTAASSGTAPVTSVTGTSNQISATAGTTPVLSLSSTVIFPGTVTLNADPVLPLQAATKQYVDSLSAGFSFKAACVATTTGNLVGTYNNGAAGVGATLTNSGTQVAFSTDGYSPALNGRVLLKDQTNAANNGIYALTTIGSGSTNWVLTRTTDYDAPGEIAPGNFIVVTNGTLYMNTTWIENNTVVVVGTDPIVFNQFAPVVVGVTSVSGTMARITSTGGTTPIIDISASYVGQASITTLGTITAGTWNGSVIDGQYGGTGVANAGKTITLGGNLATSGAFPATFVLTGATNVTFPTSGTLSTTVGTVTSVSGTTNRITSTGGATPIIDIAATYAGQSSIITLGTITTGTWNASVVAGQYGGTGVANAGRTITLGGNISTGGDLNTVGAFAATLTFTGTTNVTFPTSGTLSTTVGTVTSVTGTLDRITSTGGATPVIDIAATYAGQTSIVTVGIVTAGIWRAGIITGDFGGTGINNGSKTITLGGNLTTSGAFNSTFTMTGTTAVTFPTSGTLATVAGTVASVSGTTGQIVSTGGNNPVISIDPTYVGQSSINTLGTITTGVWNGTIVSPAFGGTGINNASNTLTLAGSLSTVGAFPAVFNFTAATNVTFPVSGTLSTTVGTVTSVSGTTNRITSTGGATPVIDISASYVGQSSITTLGTIGSGTWNGSIIGSTYGGTGVNNGASIITLGGSLTTVGAFASTFTMTANTSVTFPVSGTLATVGATVASVSGTAARITSTGGNNPVIDIDAGYVGQSSITTLGTVTTGTWNGTLLSPVYGGTGVNNGVKTITLGGNLTTSGAFNATFTLTGATNVTFPTSGTLSTTVGTVTSVTGTANRITSTGGAAPVIDIASTYVGQTSITTVGTISAGTWNGTIVSPVYGGTGVNNGSSTISLGGSLTTSGAFASTFVMTGATNVTFPTTGTLATTSNAVASVSGTTNRITSTGGLNPVIDIAATYVGQASITTVGTITSGTWNGTIVTGQYGGTGVANTGKTITLGGNLTTVGAFNSTFTMTTTTAVTYPPSGTLLSTINPTFDACNGRLTLTTNLPITTADVVGAGTIYFTPYKGSYITIYDGTNWNLYTFTQLSIAVPAGAVGAVFDVFVTAPAGVMSLVTTAWTNTSTRATALTFQNGIYVKSGTPAQRYLGSFILTATGTTEDSVANRYLYNYYNRVKRPMYVIATASWSYGSATVRQANASTANQLDFCIGVVEDMVEASVSSIALAGGLLGAIGYVAIGLNSTTTPATGCVYGAQEMGTSGDYYFLNSQASILPALGSNSLTWLEATTSSSATYGNTGTTKSGIIGNVWL